MTENDDTAAPLADFDFGEWLAGASGTVRSVTIYQRADLKADLDELERRIRIADDIPKGDRGLNDDSPESLRQEWAVLAEQFQDSALTIRIRGRSDDWLEKTKKRAKKNHNATDAEVPLYQVAESIVSPQGITVEHLKALSEISEVQVKMLIAALSLASYEPPQVSAPFSQDTSRTRGGRK